MRADETGRRMEVNIRPRMRLAIPRGRLPHLVLSAMLMQNCRVPTVQFFGRIASTAPGRAVATALARPLAAEVTKLGTAVTTMLAAFPASLSMVWKRFCLWAKRLDRID